VSAVAASAVLLLAVLLAGVWQFWLLQGSLQRQAALSNAMVTERDRLLQLVNEETGVRGYSATGNVRRARHDLVIGKTSFDELRSADALSEQQVAAELHAQQIHTLLLVRAGLVAGVLLCGILLLCAIGFAIVIRRAMRYRAHSLLDPLTGASNRRGATAAIEALTQAHDSRAFGLVFIDLDGFKKVNDAYGHAAGDAILRRVAERLRAELREGDEVCRLGGDEFLCIVSPPATLDQVRRVAQP
jgi:GGDEF domain-containing protein